MREEGDIEMGPAELTITDTDYSTVGDQEMIDCAVSPNLIPSPTPDNSVEMHEETVPGAMKRHQPQDGKGQQREGIKRVKED